MDKNSLNEVFGKVEVDTGPDFLQLSFNASTNYTSFFANAIFIVSLSLGIFTGFSQEIEVPLATMMSFLVICFLMYQFCWMIWGVSYLIVSRTEIKLKKELFGKAIRRPRTYASREITGIRVTLRFFRFFLRVPLDSWLYDRFWGELMFSYRDSVVRFAPRLTMNEVRFVMNELQKSELLNKEQFHSFLR